ncbi:MAG: hypothetical protein NC453_29795 [Muribaculum sp.]|nr:hypothetical protein [Muribaculum sp.]
MEKSQRQFIAERFRKMKVGEVIHFPFSEYNPSTIRSTPASSLLKEVSEGYKWRTKANITDKCIDVIRVS